MKQLLRCAALLLLAGMATNVAIAWGLAAFVHVASETSLAEWRPPAASGQVGWDVFRYENWAGARVIANVRQQSMLPPSQRKLHLYPPGSGWPAQLDLISSGPPPHPGAMMLDCRGWPMLSMQAVWDRRIPAADSTRRWRWGVSLSPAPTKLSGGINMNDLKVLPLMPIWPGFLFNSLIFAVGIGCVAMCWTWMRQRRQRSRLKRGLCPACGYPIGASPTCSECGQSVVP